MSENLSSSLGASAPTLSVATGNVRHAWIALLIVLVVTAATFWGVTRLGWINWDDNYYVYENEMVQRADYEAIFTTPVIGNYNPLPIAMFAWEWGLVGDDPWLYHFNNLWMHLACTCLVYWLVSSLGLKPMWAGFVALLFGIHPLHVESVAWITERKDVMYGMFYLGALVTYLRYRATKDMRMYIICCILFVLALLSKIQAVTLPLAMLAVDWYQGRKWERRVLLEKVPFFIGALVIGLVGVSILARIEGFNTQSEWSIGERIALGTASYCVYLVKAVVPYETCLIYPYPERVTWLHWLSIAGAIAVGFVAIRWRRQARAFAFGLGFFTLHVVFLLQILGAGHAYQADRFVYIAYIGLFFAMAEFGQRISTTAWKWVAMGAGLLLSGAMAVLSLQYIPKWENSGTLWDDMISKYPRRFALAYVNRGEYLKSTQQQDKGMADFTTAIEISPLLHLGYLHRGDLYFERGQDAQAIADYSRVLEILGPYGTDPIKNDAIAQAVGNRGSLHARNGRYPMALADLDQALALHPEEVNLRNSRGLTLYYMGDFARSAEDFSAILQQDRNSVPALVNRSSCYIALQRWQEALTDCERALQLDPGNQAATGIRQMAMDSLQ